MQSIYGKYDTRQQSAKSKGEWVKVRYLLKLRLGEGNNQLKRPPIELKFHFMLCDASAFIHGKMYRLKISLSCMDTFQNPVCIFL